MTALFTAKPFIICEIGSNWRTLDDCLVSIGAAKAVGADAVKFQAFTHGDLYGRVGDYGTKMRGELDDRWLPKLKAACDEVGIEFMCTAFSPELVQVVDPYVSVHKVASSDAAWPQMLEAVARTGKPVLISFGGKDSAQQNKAVWLLRDKGCQQLVTMVCTAAYPADFADLSDLELYFDYHDNSGVGFSDHTLGYTAAVEASKDKGCVVIEKHFTAFPHLDTPDRPHSLTPDQFTRMVKLIRGEPVESEEKDMFLRHNRRLIATRDLAPGEKLTYGENFGAYRSLVDDTRGLSPFRWEEVQGKSAKVEIKRGAAIGEGDYSCSG